jgi:hypothetical protein
MKTEVASDKIRAALAWLSRVVVTELADAPNGYRNQPALRRYPFGYHSPVFVHAPQAYVVANTRPHIART